MHPVPFAELDVDRRGEEHASIRRDVDPCAQDGQEIPDDGLVAERGRRNHVDVSVDELGTLGPLSGDLLERRGVDRRSCGQRDHATRIRRSPQRAAGVEGPQRAVPRHEGDAMDAGRRVDHPVGGIAREVVAGQACRCEGDVRVDGQGRGGGVGDPGVDVRIEVDPTSGTNVGVVSLKQLTADTELRRPGDDGAARKGNRVGSSHDHRQAWVSRTIIPRRTRRRPAG